MVAPLYVSPRAASCNNRFASLSSITVQVARGAEFILHNAAAQGIVGVRRQRGAAAVRDFYKAIPGVIRVVLALIVHQRVAVGVEGEGLRTCRRNFILLVGRAVLGHVVLGHARPVAQGVQVPAFRGRGTGDRVERAALRRRRQRATDKAGELV